MKLLIPYDIDTTCKRNPFLFLLLRALKQHPEVESVQHGFGWLNEQGRRDVIHLHWPEALVEPLLSGAFVESALRNDHITRLEQLLESWKKAGSRLVMTVHNEQPHSKNRSGNSSELYRRVYNLMDGFIHMGSSSRQLFAERYPKISKNTHSFVIPHGDYSIFPNEVSRPASRERLEVPAEARLLLAFGAIRNQKELNLGIDAFKKAKLPGSVYLMAGKLPDPYKSQLRHFRTRTKLYLNRFNRRIRADERIIPPEEVQYYLNAADLLLIPRFNTLNSGNVALGFTFGRVVAGPRYGVIGELLEATGNPVFDPEDPESVKEAIQKGFELAGKGHGEKNLQYCRETMNWESIGQQHLEAYRELTGERRNV